MATYGNISRLMFRFLAVNGNPVQNFTLNNFIEPTVSVEVWRVEKNKVQ